MRISKIEKELELIESIIAAHAQGIGIANIEAEFLQRSPYLLNRRTLQLTATFAATCARK